MAVITSLNLVAGVSQHVTILDANNGFVAIPPANITWIATSGFPSTSIITADATGFVFLATTPATGGFQATYHNGAVSVPAANLPVTVIAGVQPVYSTP